MYNDRNNIRKGAASSLPAQRKSMSPASRRQIEEEAPLFKKIFMSSLFGVAINTASGLMLVALSAFFALASSDPLSLIPTLAFASLLPSNFAGGFASAKKCREAALPCGFMTAAIWGALSLIVSIVLYSMPSSGYDLLQGLLFHGLSLLFCVLGSLAGSIKKSRPRNKRRFG